MITSVHFDATRTTELKADSERPPRFLLWQLTANALLRVLLNRERVGEGDVEGRGRRMGDRPQDIEDYDNH